MSLANHDRLDKILHSEEYIGMQCGSLGYIREEGSGVANKPVSLVTGADGQPKTEKKYCGSDCPTLIAEHRAGH